MSRLQVHLLAHLSFCNIRNTLKREKAGGNKTTNLTL